MSSHASFHRKVHDAVRSIPPGRVATYGGIARVVGFPGRARQVGYALAALRDGSDVPWHRVINARGEVSARAGGSGFERLQRVLLESEGVRFDDRGRVDLERFGWP